MIPLPFLEMSNFASRLKQVIGAWGHTLHLNKSSDVITSIHSSEKLHVDTNHYNKMNFVLKLTDRLTSILRNILKKNSCCLTSRGCGKVWLDFRTGWGGLLFKFQCCFNSDRWCYASRILTPIINWCCTRQLLTQLCSGDGRQCY